MYDKKGLFNTYPDVYEYLNFFFSKRNKNYPCIYGVKSYISGFMYFGVSSEFLISDITNELLEFSKLLSVSNISDKEKSLITYVHIVNNNKDVSLSPEFLVDLIIKELHSGCYPDSSEDDFLVNFNGYNWFPVIMLPNQKNKTRYCKYPLIAFQPYNTIDFNKKNNSIRHDQIRNAIHKKINLIYNGKLPDYMIDTGGGNINQFAGVIIRKK